MLHRLSGDVGGDVTQPPRPAAKITTGNNLKNFVLMNIIVRMVPRQDREVNAANSRRSIHIGGNPASISEEDMLVRA
jgi:hypothetical protein